MDSIRQVPQPTTLDFVLDPTRSGPGVTTLRPTRVPLDLNALTINDITVHVACLAYHLAFAKKTISPHALLSMTFSGERLKQEPDLTLTFEPTKIHYLSIRNDDEITLFDDTQLAMEYLTHTLKVRGIRDPSGMYRSIYENASRIIRENPQE